MRKQYIISGIGTGIGKTVVSAIVAEALKANYWKPVQAGDLDLSDSIRIGQYTENVTVLPERFRLSAPMSPHAAARIDGVEITLDEMHLPEVDGNLIVEGAGGVLVPLNDEGLLYADVFKHWNLPVIVVSHHYLGSINHTLMTCEVLVSRRIPIHGVIFVGEENKETEHVILSTTRLPMLARIPWANEVSKEFVLAQANRIKNAV